MTNRHDAVVVAFAAELRRAGHLVATEAGIPGGRVDVVRLDEHERWVELYEVKVRAPLVGIKQLATYAESVDGDPILTLVVPPDLATDELLDAAEAEGVGVHRFDHLSVLGSRADAWDRVVHLPYIHPVVVAQMSARWRAEQVTA